MSGGHAPTPGEAAFIALRMATLARVPGFRGGAEAAGRLGALYARGRTLGGFAVEHGDGWQLVHFRDPQVWYGGEATIAFADRDPASPSALAALGDALAEHAAALDATTLLEIAADDDALRVEVTARAGLGVDSVFQVGSAATALARLVADAPTSALAAGPLADLRIREATPRDIPAIVELMRAAFSAEPAYCWFGAYPQHLANVARDLEAALRHDTGVHLVVEDSAHTVLGHAGADVEAHPLWGRSAGLELVVAPALRGRGLLRRLYREQLARLVHVHRVETLRGGTSQPGVLALGRRMGRVWAALHMRRAVAFPFEHFAPFRALATLPTHPA